MKKRHDVFFGFTVLLITVMFTVAGCPTPTNGGGNNSANGPNLFTGAFVSGSFTKNGGGEVKFGLKQDEAAPAGSLMSGRALRSVSQDAENTLSGVLEDGGVAVRLTGMYDPSTGNWSVSARYGSAIYAVDGNFNTSTGDSEGSIATVVAEDSGMWTPRAFWVTEAPVSVPESAAASQECPLPAIAQGTWSGGSPVDTSGNKLEANCLISDWKMSITGTRTVSWGSIPLNQDINILEVGKSGASYELIYCYAEYVMAAENYAKALAEYMGLEESAITVLSTAPDGNEQYYWVFDADGVNGPEQPGAGGFTERAEFEALASFETTGFWKRWAARNNIETRNRYEKYRVSFPDDNTLTMIQMVEGTIGNYTYYFDSLADLKAAQLAEEQGNYYDADNKLVSLPKVITYTRSQ